MKKSLFVMAFFFAYTMQAITGFAGNVFVMPVGTMLLGLDSTVTILNILGVFACGLLTLANIKSVNWHELVKIVCVMTVFMFVGIWINSLISLRVLLRIFGVIVIVIGLKNLLAPQQKVMSEWKLVCVLALAGLIQGMFVSGGALLVIYALQKLQDRKQFRITLSATWAILNFIYASLAIYQGHCSADVMQIVAICIPLAVVATFLGNKLQKKISQENFLKIVYVMLLCIGVVVLITA